MIPKSLHTVTVLVNMARVLSSVYRMSTDAQLINLAAIELGYEGTDDIYDLKGQALKKFSKLHAQANASIALTLVKVA